MFAEHIHGSEKERQEEPKTIFVVMQIVKTTPERAGHPSTTILTGFHHRKP
jgi:hypothetical protein